MVECLSVKDGCLGCDTKSPIAEKRTEGDYVLVECKACETRLFEGVVSDSMQADVPPGVRMPPMGSQVVANRENPTTVEFWWSGDAYVAAFNGVPVLGDKDAYETFTSIYDLCT